MDIKPVSTWQDALLLLGVRNQCRLFMTGSQEPIGIRQQAAWWHCYRYENDGMRVYLGRVGRTVVAYGVIRELDGQPTVSGGVARAARGTGFGRLLFAFLTAEVKKPAVLEVLETNLTARHLYESLDWREAYTQPGRFGFVVHMTHD